MITRTRFWVGLGVALVLCGGPAVSPAWAQTAPKSAGVPGKLSLPPVFEKAVPETVADLRALEQHVQKVLEKVMPSVVGLRIGAGQGSGVIISEDGVVLTAGHVSGAPNRTAFVVMPDGKQVKGKTLGQNKTIDSGMVRITDEGKYPFLEMGKSADLKKGQWVLAVGHPGGFRPNRTPVVRLGRILVANGFVIQTDCTLVGGDSGGPLFDMQGRVIGIHSRIGGLAIVDNIHVPIDTYHQTFERLAQGDSWGIGIGRTFVRSAGGKLVFEKKDALAKDDPTGPSPAGNGELSHRKTYTFAMKAGSTYTIDLLGGDKTGKAFDPFLRLETLAGKLLAEDDDGGGFPHARIIHKALHDGDYRIIATSFDPKQTGTFTLKIFEADFKDALVSGQVEVLRTIMLPRPSLLKLIEQFNSYKRPLYLSAIVLDDKGNPWPDQSVTLKWDKGSVSLKSQHDGAVRWPLQFDKSGQLQLQFPAGSRAWLAVTDQEGVGVAVSKSDPAVEKVKSAGGPIVKSIDAVLNKSDSFDRVRAKCYCRIHEFPMQAGKTYTIDLVSDDFDAYLRLENAAGEQFAEDNDGAGFLNSRIVFTPGLDDVLRLIATTTDPGQFGAYRLSVRETAAPADPKTANQQ